MWVTRTSKNIYRLVIDGHGTKTVFHSIKAMLAWMDDNKIYNMEVNDLTK